MEHLCFSSLKDGDNLAVALTQLNEIIGFGYHVGVFIVTTNGPVVYEFNNSGIVATELSDFKGKNSVMYRVMYECKTHKPDAIKTRAMKVHKNPRKYGFAKYCLTNNNCQHFASYVTMRKRFSFEISKLDRTNKLTVKFFSNFFKSSASK